MSNIVNPRIENYYLHPKKYAWRADSKVIRTEEKLPADEGKKIASAFQEHLKMVIHANLNMEAIPQNGMSHVSEVPVRPQNHPSVTQDAPLDFSVKAVEHSNDARVSELERSFPDLPSNGNIEMHHDSEYISNDKKSTPVGIYSGKISSSTVPIYNESPKFQRPKPRNFTSSHPVSYGSTHLPLLSEENERSNQMFIQDTSAVRSSILTEQGQAQNSNLQIPLDTDEPNSATCSPRLSRENSPDSRSCRSSILQGVLSGRPGERSHIPEVNSYLEKMKPLQSYQKTGSVNLTPSFLGTNTPATGNLIIPDTGSMLSGTGAVVSGSNSLLQGTGFTFLNGLGFSQTAMNGMNHFNSGSVLSSTMENRLPSTQATGEKKSKPVRPFKAITNELLYGIPATMTLPTINQVMPSGGYFKDYFHGSTKDSTDPSKSSPVSKKESLEMPAIRAINSSPPCSSNGTESKPDAACSGDSNCSYTDTSAVETAEATSNNNNRKRKNTLPDGIKDEAYWERRRKNNQAAKRSRDARRQKEDMVAQQAWLFREHNIQLRYQMSSIEEQYQHLQIQYRAKAEHAQNLELQLRLMTEKLSRSRCGKCGSRIENDSSENGFSDSNKNEHI